ncbi:hypothetical protein Vretimale_18463 [Volvox reticuliferus]|nr:hypothetical protein Vretimale_18463 [Volvox reticuliferus]
MGASGTRASVYWVERERALHKRPSTSYLQEALGWMEVLNGGLLSETTRDGARRCGTMREKVGKMPSGSLKREAANSAVIEWLRGPCMGVGSRDASTSKAAPSEPSAAAAKTETRTAAEPAAPEPDGAPDMTASSTGVGHDGGGGGGGGAKGTLAGPARAAVAGPSARDLGLQSVWLLMGGTKVAFDLVDGPGGLLHWMQEDERARPVISGGVSSGRGDLFFHPGRAGTAAVVDTAAPADARGEREGGEAGPSSGLCRGAATAVLGDWDPAVKGLHYVGLAVMASEAAAPVSFTNRPPTSDAATASSCGGSGNPPGRAEGLGSRDALTPGSSAAGQMAPVEAQAVTSEPPQAAVRACALAMRGCAGLDGQPVSAGVAISREAPSWRDLEESSDDEERDNDEDGVAMVTVSGGVPSSLRSLAEQLRAGSARLHSLPQLAVWLAKRGDESIHSGLDVQVFRSGRLVIGPVEPSLLLYNGTMAFKTRDVVSLDAITENANAPGAVVCCQLADITPRGCRLHLQAELPVLRSVCSPYPLLPGGRLDPRSWEGYAVMRQAAMRVGARAGPVAMVVFSCTARGRKLFGDASAECEARIADEVLHKEVPFVGAYCNGELGPHVRHEYAGWFFNPLCVQPPVATEALPANAAERGDLCIPAAAATAAGCGAGSGSVVALSGGAPCNGEPRFTVVAGGRVMPLDRTCMQGYTSVYATLG